MTLVDQGKLDLDDPVSKYIPVLDKYMKSYITIRQCLSHTTGLDNGKNGIAKLLERRKFETLEEDANAIAAKEISNNAGTEFAYGSSGLNLAARVAENFRYFADVVGAMHEDAFRTSAQLGYVIRLVDVVRNDAATAEQVLADAPSHIVLSPGPGTPAESGVCQELCRRLARAEVPAIPVLGVCLGHQTLCEVLGARVERAGRIMHGKLSPMLHDATGVFAGLPSPFTATRYHSLVAVESTLPPELVPNARTDQGELMGVSATNKAVDITVCNIVELRDGQVFQEREYVDGAAILTQIGALGSATHA